MNKDYDFNINGTDIYNRIIYLININHLKNSDFYKDIGITSQIFSNWKYRSIPSLDVLYKIKIYFNCSLDWLITGKEYIAKENERNIQIENVKKEINFLLDTLK